VKQRGYALFDVLIAISLLTLGFAAIYSLTESAVKQTQEGKNLLEAANIAQSQMDEFMATSSLDNNLQGPYVPGSTVEGEDGSFHWQVRTWWDETPSLLRVEVEVSWLEAGRTRRLVLRGMSDVE